MVERLVLGAQLPDCGERGQRRDPPVVAHLRNLLGAGGACVHQQRPQAGRRELIDPGQRGREHPELSAASQARGPSPLRSA